MEREGRLLHKDWSRYDTANVVFRPRHMTPEQLAEGYAWCYQQLFSHRSIWRRRPEQWAAVPPYLAMSYLYKRSNWLWYYLIRWRLTGLVWRPLVEWTRLRHVRYRAQLAARRNQRCRARVVRGHSGCLSELPRIALATRHRPDRPPIPRHPVEAVVESLATEAHCPGHTPS